MRDSVVQEVEALGVQAFSVEVAELPARFHGTRGTGGVDWTQSEKYLKIGPVHAFIMSVISTLA